MKLYEIAKTRTNNFAVDVMAAITDVWQKAESKLAAYKGNRFAVYHNYENNYKGDYTLSIAVEKQLSNVEILVNQTQYKVFKVNPKNNEGTLETWQLIWNLEDEEKNK